MKIAVVVVTYNRKGLLKECISAIQAQTVRPHTIIVIDNASTDGTDEFLREQRGLTVIRNEVNTGGAGGFHLGMRTAYEDGADWIWVMDDDTIPEPSALERLVAASNLLNDVPAVLASRVNWVDGTLHPVNLPAMLPIKVNGLSRIRNCSFVSAFVNRVAVERCGLPIAAYFIWNDDVEFTARVIRRGVGLYVDGSVVTHKTVERVPSINGARVARRYYSLRNRIWMLLWSDAWTPAERIALLPTIGKVMASTLREGGLAPSTFRLIVRGVADGLLTRPR